MIEEACLVDVETTGLDPKKDVITEVYALRFNRRTFEIIAEGGGLILPRSGIEVPKFIKNERTQKMIPIKDMNGYDPEVWKDYAMNFCGMLSRLKVLIDGAVFTGSNPRFDLAFLNEAYVHRGHLEEHAEPFKPAGHRLLDISSMAEPLFHSGLVDDTGLDSLCNFFNIGGTKHRAKADVYRGFEVLMRLSRMTCEGNSGMASRHRCILDMDNCRALHSPKL